MYTVEPPAALLHLAIERLVKEGYLRRSALPFRWIESSEWSGNDVRPRPIRMGTGVSAEEYWRCDFTLYTDQFSTVRSPYRAQHKAWAGRRPSFAATFDQWGIVIGSLLDVATEPVRLLGAYDPLAKHAPVQRWGLNRGEPYATSHALFTHRTVGAYTRTARADAGVDLSCTRHVWVTRGEFSIPTCNKCGRQHRF